MDTTTPPPLPEATPGARMLYLIRCRPSTTREELIMHWFANHMAAVIRDQLDRAEQGKSHARRYIATLFDADKDGSHPWDGVAQLWFDRPLPRPEVPQGTTPTDTFQQKAEPYMPWATKEYVILDGSRHLPVEPLTLNPPFPCTRSGFFKVSFLVGAKERCDYDAFYDHWLRVHVPNVRSVMEEVGGFRYVVGHSLEPEIEPYAGIAELYFPDESGWRKYRSVIEPDGMEEWVDATKMLVLRARTEMVGIP